MTLVGGEAEPVGAGEAADVEPYHAKLGQGYRVLYMIREKEQFLTCVVETSDRLRDEHADRDRLSGLRCRQSQIHFRVQPQNRQSSTSFVT